MKKKPVNPIWVSDIIPVSVNGRLLSWNVNVRFDGDLALWHNENPLPRNIEEFKKFMKWTDADIKKIEDEEVFGHKSIERVFFEFKQEAAFLYETEMPYFLKTLLFLFQEIFIVSIGVLTRSPLTFTGMIHFA
jgi:hypothetical protein